MDDPFWWTPHQFAFPLLTTIISLLTMSSAQATGIASPSPRSPLMNVNWGVRRHGLEEFPPMLGVDEFAVVNPDFWSGTPEEQRAFQGWYRFSDVSFVTLFLS